jgi:hypothetical protein
VHSIAIEVPASLLTDSKAPADYPIARAPASTSRRVQVIPASGMASFSRNNKWCRSTPGQPVDQEAIKPPAKSLEWHVSRSGGQFVISISILVWPGAGVFGVPAEKSDRQDLVNLLLKYSGQTNGFLSCCA